MWHCFIKSFPVQKECRFYNCDYFIILFFLDSHSSAIWSCSAGSEFMARAKKVIRPQKVSFHVKTSHSVRHYFFSQIRVFTMYILHSINQQPPCTNLPRKHAFIPRALMGVGCGENRHFRLQATCMAIISLSLHSDSQAC